MTLKRFDLNAHACNLFYYKYKLWPHMNFFTYPFQDASLKQTVTVNEKHSIHGAVM